ncbi:hypothetical protein ILUMI_02759, partial [Ignelater luminosus]
MLVGGYKVWNKGKERVMERSNMHRKIGDYDAYKTQREIVKRLINSANKRKWEKFGSNKRSGRRSKRVYTPDNNKIISNKELDYALKRLKLGKAEGHDLIILEMIKYLSNGGKQMLLRLLNKVWI